MKSKRQFDREFKLNAVKLYQEGNKNVEKLAADLGVSKATLANWVANSDDEESLFAFLTSLFQATFSGGQMPSPI